jgi:hypothetical protein
MQQLCYCGEKLKGKYTIAKRFHDLMRQVSMLGDIVLAVDKVDHQALQGAVSSSDNRPYSALPAKALPPATDCL